MRLGVLIGANVYDKLGPLKFCVQDILGLKEILSDSSRGGFRDEFLRVLVDGGRPPSKANIVDEVTMLASKATENDEILFYFSGHGFEVDGDAYLAPLDARTSRADDTAIDVGWLGDALRESKARTKIVILDACYSGLEPGKASSGGMSESFEAVLHQMASSGSGTIILTSCSKDEVSFEESSMGHGVFTHFLIEGLRGNADSDTDYDITVTEAYNYVQQKVNEYSLASGNKQTPNLIGSMAGDIVLVRVPRPQAQPASSGGAKVTRIIISKSGESYSEKDYDVDAMEYASADVEKLSGELGAIFARLFSPQSVTQAESEYRFPGGSYSVTYGSDEYGTTYSAWANAKLDSVFPEKEFEPLVSGWNPDKIEIHLDTQVDINQSHSSLASKNFRIERFIPGRLVSAITESGQSRITIRNLEVEAMMTVERVNGNLANSMSNFGLPLLLSFAVWQEQNP